MFNSLVSLEWRIVLYIKDVTMPIELLVDLKLYASRSLSRTTSQNNFAFRCVINHWSKWGGMQVRFEPDPWQLLGEIGGSFSSTLAKAWPQAGMSALMTPVQSIGINPIDLKPFLLEDKCISKWWGLTLLSNYFHCAIAESTCELPSWITTATAAATVTTTTTTTTTTIEEDRYHTTTIISTANTTIKQ